jgi:peptidylprolyl isomerase
VRRRRGHAWLAGALVAAWTGWGCAGPGPAPAPLEPQREPERVAFPETPELAEIAHLEYARDLGGGRLRELLETGTAEVRRRAALALGRFPYPRFGAEVTGALARALEDEDPYVRRIAVFGLGVRADPGAGTLLAAYRNDADPELRAAVAAASRSIDSSHLRDEVLHALADRELEVRIAAVLAIGVWPPDAPRAGEADRRLIDLLLPTDAPGIEVDPELRWRILFALARRKSELGRGPFLVFHGSELVLERLFSARGLAAISPDETTLAALVERSADEDWRVAVEALVGLGRHARPETLPAVLAATEHDSVHVRRAAYEALGAFAGSDRAVQKLSRGARDVSPSAQAVALQALARLLPSEDAAEELTRHVRDDDPVVRSGVATAAAALETPQAAPILTALAKDSDARVAGAALEALGAHVTPDVRRLLHAALAHPDNGLRLAAVLALREAPDASDVEPLGEAIATARDDIAPEVTFNALRNLGAIGGDAARELVTKALAHAEPYVRQVAREVLADAFGVAHPPSPDVPPEAVPDVPLPGRDFPRYERNPEVVIATTRGEMLFELFPAEAPVHVHNFLTLAERGHYKGLNFHRVVPDFVAQGGDYRGDGNGGDPWNGRALPAEITPRRYVRGSLGMPRNEDLDSGGSQIFVTHRPTPHLDQRYTIFGELRAGGAVLDRIEVGDRILDVRLR